MIEVRVGWVKERMIGEKVFDKENGFPPHPHQLYCLAPFKSLSVMTKFLVSRKLRVYQPTKLSTKPLVAFAFEVAALRTPNLSSNYPRLFS